MMLTMADLLNWDTGPTDMSGNEQLSQSSETDPDVSLTTAQAAEMAGVSPRTIRRWIEKGTLPAMTGAGGVFYVFARDVENARLASLSRSPGTPHMTARLTVVEDNNTVPDSSGAAGTADMVPDPAGGAAGAILVAWRDTVLAPVVEELSATRRELGQISQELGRAEAERDQAARERDALRVELTAAQRVRDQAVSQGTIQVPPRDDLPEPTPKTDERPWWRRLVDRLS
jgi:excisionase family DNA binding protein